MKPTILTHEQAAEAVRQNRALFGRVRYSDKHKKWRRLKWTSGAICGCHHAAFYSDQGEGHRHYQETTIYVPVDFHARNVK